MFPPGHRVMITGHRSVRGEVAHRVRDVLSTILERIQVRHEEGVVAVCGMAVGADAEFAEAALSLAIPLVAAVPCETQSDPWPAEARCRYDRLLNQASHVVEVWKLPDYRAHTIGSQMFARDRWMVDHSDTTIAVWDGRKSGGTWHTVQETARRGRKVLVVDPISGTIRSEAPSAFAQKIKSVGPGEEHGLGPEQNALGLFGTVLPDSVEVLNERARYKPVILPADYDQGEPRIHTPIHAESNLPMVDIGWFRGVDAERKNG